MKIVINSQIGGFSVTRRIASKLADLGVEPAITELELMEGEDLYESLGDHYPLFQLSRKDPRLVEIVEKYPDEVPHLQVVEIPDGIVFYIDANEMGVETIHEEHCTWN